MNDLQDFRKAVSFINEIGIKTDFKTLSSEECFLPGLLIEKGRIIVDESLLKYPGDILHEAAHLAVVPAAERDWLDGPALAARKDAPAEEMMAIAWSYAACIHLQIDPTFVFHEQGYKGGGNSIVENFREKRYFGVPMLQWLGMTAADGDEPYPVMKKWLRD